MKYSSKSSPNLKENNQSAPQKKKILLVGDSISRKLNLSVLKNVTDMEIKRVEAFTVSQNDPKARFPDKNFNDVVPSELAKEAFSTLILQGGTNEISNLETSGKTVEKIEAFKKKIRVSSENSFKLAEKSLAETRGLENVVILKRIFRCDTMVNDPGQIRNKLSEYGNRVLDDIWLTKGCPKNIMIGQQTLECQGDLRISRFGSPSDKNYDGIHMRGKLAVQHYTGSVINVLLDVLPGLSPNTTKVNITPQPPTYANVARRTQTARTTNMSSQHSMFNPTNQNSYRPGQPSFTPVQSQFGKTFPEMSGKHEQRATAGNTTPLMGNYYQYNLKTQNRFSPVSGN